MVYIASDGRVGGKKSWWTFVVEFFNEIFLFISLFFSTITNPKSIQRKSVASRRDTNQTYAQRHKGRSYRADAGGASGTAASKGTGLRSNIKGLDQLGAAKCAVGGG